MTLVDADLTTSVNIETLRQLNPLHQLDEDGLYELSTKLHIETLPSGRNLFVRGQTDPWHYYLLQGQVLFTAPQHENQLLSAQDKRAALPLKPHLPRKFTATAANDIEFIRIDRDLLELLLSKEKLPLYQVDELSDDTSDLTRQLFYRIVHDYISNRLIIPSMPELAIRITRAVDDPEMNVLKLTKLLQFDPAISARIIQVANSPLYRSETPMTTTRHAVEHLGFDVTRQLAVSFTIQQLYQAKNKILRNYLRQLWRANSRIAALSFILARYAQGLNPERAFLAGILCRIGALPIIQQAGQYPPLLKNIDILNSIVIKLSPIIGAMILRKWEFGQEMLTVVLESDTWHRDPDRHPDYCDVVLLARLHHSIGQHQYSHLPPINSVPAFNKIASGHLTPHGSLVIIEQAREEIEELERLINLGTS